MNARPRWRRFLLGEFRKMNSLHANAGLAFWMFAVISLLCFFTDSGAYLHMWKTGASLFLFYIWFELNGDAVSTRVSPSFYSFAGWVLKGGFILLAFSFSKIAVDFIIHYEYVGVNYALIFGVAMLAPYLLAISSFCMIIGYIFFIYNMDGFKLYRATNFRGKIRIFIFEGASIYLFFAASILASLFILLYKSNVTANFIYYSIAEFIYKVESSSNQRCQLDKSHDQSRPVKAIKVNDIEYVEVRSLARGYIFTPRSCVPRLQAGHSGQAIMVSGASGVVVVVGNP